MRSESYLSEPGHKSKLKSFSGEKLDSRLLNLQEFGQETKKQNILKIMNWDDFVTSLPSQKLDVFKTEVKSALETGEQIKILLSCEENPEIRATQYEHWKEEQSCPTYDENQFLANLLKDNFSFDEWNTNDW